jgi:hypothetical protein
MRPPDPAFGEDESLWVERARDAAARGPLGHHTHWTAPDHARPTAGDLVTDRHKETGARVLSEGRWMRERGLDATLFCGGGWYTDADVAEACAELGSVDCTPRARRPPYLAASERWVQLDEPARIALPSGLELPAIPTTHSLGDLARALLRPWSLPEITHVYFHDTDLGNARRTRLLRVLLPTLARLAAPADLDELATRIAGVGRQAEWDDLQQN